MNVALVKSKAEQPYGELFASARSRLPGSGPVADVRQKAFDDFEKRGLPHRRIEEWKYTDLRALLREVAPLAASPDKAAMPRAKAAVTALGVEGTLNLVLVDGVFAPELSDLSGLEKTVKVQTLREVLDNANNPSRADLLLTSVASDAMISLNAAMATDGVVVFVEDNAKLSKPIHIVHVATAPEASAFTRSLVKIANGVHATQVESIDATDGAKAYQVYDSYVFSFGDESELQLLRLVEDARDAANITTAVFTLGAKARLNTFGLTQGASVSRYQGFITFAGENSELSTNGVNLLGGKRLGDTTFVVDHSVPHCTSRGFSRAGDEGVRQAIGVSRQRGIGAEAECRAGSDDAGLSFRIRQRASRSA